MKPSNVYEMRVYFPKEFTNQSPREYLPPSIPPANELPMNDSINEEVLKKDMPKEPESGFTPRRQNTLKGVPAVQVAPKESATPLVYNFGKPFVPKDSSE